MSKILRSPGLTRFLVLTAVGLVPIGFPLLIHSPSSGPSLATQDYGGQDPGGQECPTRSDSFPAMTT